MEERLEKGINSCYWRSGLGAFEIVSLELDREDGLGEFGGRPRIWLAQTPFPPNGRENTWDVYRWMLDIFPTVRSNGFVFLDRNCLGSFLLSLRILNVDLSDEVIDSF